MPGNPISWVGLLVHNGQVNCSQGILELNYFSGPRSQKDPVSGMFACFGGKHNKQLQLTFVAADQGARWQSEHLKLSQNTRREFLLSSIFTERKLEVEGSSVTGPRLYSQSVKELGFKLRQAGSRVPNFMEFQHILANFHVTRVIHSTKQLTGPLSRVEA